MVEYAVLLSLIALALVGPVFGLGQQVGNRFQSITNTLSNGGSSGTPDPGTPTPPTTSPTTTPGPDTGEKPDPDPEPGGTVDPSKTPLKDVTWEELDKLSPDAGKNPDKYKPWLGQTLQVEVDGNVYDMQLVGVGQDDLSDGSGKAGFSFLSLNVLPMEYKLAMGTKHTAADSSYNGYTNGGWDKSIVKDYLNGDFYNKSLSIISAKGNELKGLIKDVGKHYEYIVFDKSSSTSLTKKYARSSSKLWVPSYEEYYGKSSPNGFQYSYYQMNNVSEIDYAMAGKSVWGSGQGGAYRWTRSAISLNTYWTIMANGKPYDAHRFADEGYEYISLNYEFGFCI